MSNFFRKRICKLNGGWGMARKKTNLSPAKLGVRYLHSNSTLKDFQGGVGGWWVGGEMLGIKLISAQLSWDLG